MSVLMSDAIVTVRLFHESVNCQSCGHQWHGYLHGFSRGHSVLIRDGKIAFVPDDLAYAFADQIRILPDDPSTWPNDPADALRENGWRDIECCPKCGSNDFVPQYDQSSMVDVDCIEFVANDFRLDDNNWILTETGRAKMIGK